MKRLFLTLGLALASFAAVSATIGGISKGDDDKDDPFGTYKARVRWVQPHWGPDGRYLTYTYADITATSMTYCQNQLNSYTNSGASVVEYCHLA